MADLGKTDAQWLRLFRELIYFLRVYREALERRDRYFLERTQIVNEGDVLSATPHIATMTLAGIHYGTNTAEDGTLFTRIVANGGNWDIQLYKATGGGGADEVAAALNVAASATAALVAVNTSGVTGSVTLGAAIVGDVTDRHVERIFLDWKGELIQIWPSDGTTNDDAFSREVAQDMLNDLATSQRSILDRIRSGFAQWSLGTTNNPKSRLETFVGESATTVISETPNDDGSGAITQFRTGILVALDLAMQQETTGSTQDVAERVVAGAVGVFDVNNDGQGTVSTHTPDQHTPIGVWTFICVQGLGTGNGGSEKFELSFAVSDGSEDDISGNALLQIGQAYKGIQGFGQITLDRTFSKTGDGSDLNLGAVSTFSVSGSTEENTDGGVLYWEITANGSNWDVSFFKGSNRNTGDLVAQVINVATAASVQATPRGDGPTFNFDIGSAPVTTTTGTVDINFFNTSNTASIPDRFQVTTTLSSTGLFLRILEDMEKFSLNGETASSEQIDDDIVKANTLVPFIVEAN